MVEESAQQDFIMSLTGEKKITYMPTEAEIDELCEKVQSGEICVEYETHYYEFDTDGRYMDNWKIWHNDPKGAFLVLDRTFRGCRDLLQLGEYGLARKILDRICRLEFQVVEAKNTENFEDDSPFTIADAAKEQKFSMRMEEIGFHWLESMLLDRKGEDGPAFAGELLEAFRSEICKNLSPSDLCALMSEKLLDHMETILERAVDEMDAELKSIPQEGKYWRKKYEIEKKKARDEHLLLDIRRKCQKQERATEKQGQVSVLAASWKQISELLQILKYERYIDDQFEIEEICDICQALIRRGRFEEEDWKLRKEILRKMISNEYYDYYSCYDSMKELSEKLYITDEETLEYADMLDESGYYAREAADLYCKYGVTDKYVRYLETHLGRSSREYVELIQCCCDAGDKVRAREIAEQGLKQCKDDLTDVFIFLLQDAKACGEEVRYKKFYAGAKRRKMVNIVRVDEALDQ